MYLRSTLFSSLKESFALRTSRTLSVSCIHRTVGRSIRDSQSQLGIPLPAFNDNDKQCESNPKRSAEERNTQGANLKCFTKKRTLNTLSEYQ
jgi:hypothetical protein